MMTLQQRIHCAKLPYNHPDYAPLYEDYEVSEWVEKHIEYYACPEICEELGITEDQLIEEPYLLTESDYYEKNQKRFEKDYREAKFWLWDELPEAPF
jgi:hypothetical protein